MHPVSVVESVLKRLLTKLELLCRRILLTCAWLFVCTFPAAAQTYRGGISGTVFDSQGGVIPGATVTIINLGTNQRIQLTTSSNGTYALNHLDPVTYRVEAEANGFAKAVVEQVKVDTATVVNRDLTLRPTSATTEVTVQERAELLNIDSATTSQTITARQLQDVPLVNRSVLDLALTAPNVNGVAGSEDPGVTSGVTAEYDTWARANSQPLSSTSAGASQLNAIQTMVNNTRLSSGALPTDFFHIALPAGFATANANSFDIRTLNGFKLYRLRQAYGLGFGQLRELGQPRYIQFGLKIYF